MINSFRSFAALLLVFSGILGSSCQSNNKTLPIFGQRETQEKIVDGKTIVDTIYHTIPSFSLLNQDSVMVTEKDLDNKIYIANFFFTHCPTICPTMNRNLLKVYEQYKEDDRVNFVSHSIDFKYDNPSTLKNYANKLGVSNGNWMFLTGSKADVYGLADEYLVYTAEDQDAPGGYNHQGMLVLVDTEKRIRGAYDGTLDEQIELLKQDLAILLAEK